MTTYTLIEDDQGETSIIHKFKEINPKLIYYYLN